MAKQNLAKLKQRIELMKQFYYKGFWNNVAGISTAAECFVHNYGDKTEMKEHMLTLFSEIEDYYSKIPFDKLNNNTDFAPIFVVKEMLPRLKTRVKNIMANPDEAEAKRLFYLSSAIVNVGEIYRDNIRELIKEVRNTDKNYKVEGYFL